MPDVAVWNKCDNRCLMCTNPDRFRRERPANYSLGRQIRKMESYLLGREDAYYKYADDASFLTLTGGEPALHPDFFKLLVYFRRRRPGAEITLMSNGRRFADGAFTGRFLKAAAPPFRVAIALHAARAAPHDRIAGVKGAFAMTMRGLRNLFAARARPEIEIRIVLHRLNIGGFAELLAFLQRNFRRRRYTVTVLHYEIEGMSLKNHKILALPLSSSAAAVNAAAKLLSALPDIRLYHFPFCLITPALREKCRITQPEEERHYPPACGGCRLRAGCPGLMRAYHRKFGAGELRCL